MPEKETMTEDQFLCKVEWEGGVVDALEYGLRAEMLADQSSELAKIWSKLEKAWKKFQAPLGTVEQYFESWQEDDEGWNESGYDEDEEFG